MKLARYWLIVIFSNIVTASLMFGLMVHLKKKEVRRRDQLVMNVLFGDIAAFNLIKAERIEKAKETLKRNIEFVAANRNQFSPYGYDAKQEIDPKYILREE